jgi:hypothetical protein
MTNLFRRLVFELGPGRAVENARSETNEMVWTLAAIDALARRITPPAPADQAAA